MNKNVCFFTVGFAFNKLVRMRYYEKVFPKDVNIYLIATDKYSGDMEEEKKRWNLKRTKVIILKHSKKNLFEIRRVCDKEKIDALSNIGHPFGALPLIFASLFRKREVLLYILGDSIDYPKIDMLTKSGIRYLFSLIPYWFIEKLSARTAFVGHGSYRKAPIFFLNRKEKFHYLHAPVNTEIFKPFDKTKSRKNLGLKKDEKVVVYVGRISSRKGGALLRELIKTNPDVKFILIGKWNPKDVLKFNFKNMQIIEKVENKDLAKYYSAADLVFAYHKQGCQMGIVGEESLACGVPILHTARVYAPKRDFIIRVKDDIKDANVKMRGFFNLSEKEKAKLAKPARDHAKKYMSDEFWKEKYLKFFLK